MPVTLDLSSFKPNINHRNLHPRKKWVEVEILAFRHYKNKLQQTEKLIFVKEQITHLHEKPKHGFEDRWSVMLESAESSVERDESPRLSSQIINVD